MKNNFKSEFNVKIEKIEEKIKNIKNYGDDKDLQVKSIVSEFEIYNECNKEKISDIESIIKSIKDNISNLDNKVKISTAKPMFKVERSSDNIELLKIQNEINLIKEKLNNNLEENDIMKLIMLLKKKKCLGIIQLKN